MLLRFGCYTDSNFPKYHWTHKSITLNCLLGSYLSKSFTYCRSQWFLVTMLKTKPFSFGEINLNVNLSLNAAAHFHVAALLCMYVVLCFVLLFNLDNYIHQCQFLIFKMCVVKEPWKKWNLCQYLFLKNAQ